MLSQYFVFNNRRAQYIMSATQRIKVQNKNFHGKSGDKTKLTKSKGVFFFKFNLYF